ncbi:hypothetical protein PENSPDRAFT_757008 [Peniophora sp. CONT]|nr:hypothetical protein PENSPDRAFT_757008 [Peniophora sp. CONT]
MSSTATPISKSLDFEPSSFDPQPVNRDPESGDIDSEVDIDHDKILAKFGWERIGPTESLGVLHTTWWGEEYMPMVEEEEVPQDWKNAISMGVSRVIGLPEALHQLGILDINGHLPSCSYMDIHLTGNGDAGPLKATNGMVHLRSEYSKVWQDICRAMERFRGVFVGGHFQVGKTYAMVYMLTDHLRRSEPVLFRTSERLCALFLSCGVYRLATADHKPRWDPSSETLLRQIVPSRITALLKDVISEPVSPFLDMSLFYPVVFGRPRRFTELVESQGLSFSLCVLAPPSHREIVAGALIQSEGNHEGLPPRRDVGVLNNLVTALTRFGPSPFYVYQAALTSDKTRIYQELEDCLDTVDLDDLKKLLKMCPMTDGQIPRMPSTLPLIDDRLITCNRLEVQRTSTDTSLYFSPSIASPYILHRLRQEFVKSQTNETRLVMQLLFCRGGLRTAGGVMFESFMHYLLSARPSDWDMRKCFTLVEFFPWPDQWDANAAREADWGLEVAHVFRKRQEVLYDSAYPPAFDETKYYVPQLVNNPTFDAVTYVSSTRRPASTLDQPTTSIRARRSRTQANKPEPIALSHAQSSSVLHSVVLNWERSPPGGESSSEVECGSTSAARAASAADLESDAPLKKRSSGGPNTVNMAIALQMTIASQHSLVEDGLVKLRDTFNEQDEWAFVFVIPQSTTWNFATMRTRIANLHAKNAALKLDHYRWYVLSAKVDTEGFSGESGDSDAEVEADDHASPSEVAQYPAPEPETIGSTQTADSVPVQPPAITSSPSVPPTATATPAAQPTRRSRRYKENTAITDMNLCGKDWLEARKGVPGTCAEYYQYWDYIVKNEPETRNYYKNLELEMKAAKAREAKAASSKQG